MAIVVKRSVTVKAVVTEELKRQLASDLQSALARLEAELGQLDAPDRRGPDRDDRPAVAAGETPAADKLKRQQQRDQILARMRELARLEQGQEIVQGTVEGEVQVRPGDDWARLFSAEIIVRDGKVVAIRE